MPGQARGVGTKGSNLPAANDPYTMIAAIDFTVTFSIISIAIVGMYDICYIRFESSCLLLICSA